MTGNIIDSTPADPKGVVNRGGELLSSPSPALRGGVDPEEK